MALLQTNYIKRESVIHSLSPMVKFSWVLLIVSFFLLSQSIILFIIIDLAILILAFLGKVGKDFIKGLFFMIGPIFFFSLLIHGLFNPLGTGSEAVIFSFYTINISLGGLYNGLFFGFKITSLISIFYLFILTTYPGRMVTSLKGLGLPYKLGFLINATLQTVPLMLREAETIIEAQQARGLETRGSIIKRLRAYVPLLGPIVLGSVMKVYERTIALEVRGFSSKAKKTAFYVERVRPIDQFIAYFSLGLTVCYIVLWVIGWRL